LTLLIQKIPLTPVNPDRPLIQKIHWYLMHRLIQMPVPRSTSTMSRLIQQHLSIQKTLMFHWRSGSPQSDDGTGKSA
jgi:hypothetical protein